MSPFINDASVKDRIDRFQMNANHRRMAKAARAGATHRASHPIKEALGNGLIALGERLVEVPPTIDHNSFDTAA